MGSTTEEVIHKTNPLDKLRATQKAHIHLARAFIMNPEVMVLHRPFMYFPKSHGRDSKKGLFTGHASANQVPQLAYEHLMDAIVEHRDNRGFKMPQETFLDRRPRTVFYTPDTEDEGRLADYSWLLPDSPDGTVTQTNKRPRGTFGEVLRPAPSKKEPNADSGEERGCNGPRSCLGPVFAF